jgi:hypothetical protein
VCVCDREIERERERDREQGRTEEARDLGLRVASVGKLHHPCRVVVAGLVADQVSRHLVMCAHKLAFLRAIGHD